MRVCFVKSSIPFGRAAHQLLHLRTVTKVRLKWVKNRGLDHIIDTETDVKAAWMLKNAIKRSPTGYITEKTVADWKRDLGLTVPVVRFLRRYPTMFKQTPHARYPSLTCFQLTEIGQMLDSQEHEIYQSNEKEIVDRVTRFIMMTKTKTIPFQTLYPLKWDLGLPDNFDKILIPKYPERLGVVKSSTGLPCLRLLQWEDDLAMSALQRSLESKLCSEEYRKFKSGHTVLTFPMKFPKGYGGMNKVKDWMNDFHNMPYISPYEDASGIDPKSDLMEKRVVGVLHEVLSLTIHKKTWRNYLRRLREELILPDRFTRIFTRYPGIFYLSLKCKTTTVALREGYEKGKLVNPHPLARLRWKMYHVMRTGLLYRDRGIARINESEMQSQLEGDCGYDHSGESSEDEEEEEVEIGSDDEVSD